MEYGVVVEQMRYLPNHVVDRCLRAPCQRVAVALAVDLTTGGDIKEPEFHHQCRAIHADFAMDEGPGAGAAPGIPWYGLARRGGGIDARVHDVEHHRVFEILRHNLVHQAGVLGCARPGHEAR